MMSAQDEFALTPRRFLPIPVMKPWWIDWGQKDDLSFANTERRRRKERGARRDTGKKQNTDFGQGSGECRSPNSDEPDRGHARRNASLHSSASPRISKVIVSNGRWRFGP